MVKHRELLIKLRQNKNIRQKDVALILGISTSYYGMIEKGSRTPSLVLAKQISNYFEESLEKIFF